MGKEFRISFKAEEDKTSKVIIQLADRDLEDRDLEDRDLHLTTGLTSELTKASFLIKNTKLNMLF